MGASDLWALRDGNTPMFVSCKLSGRIGPAERFALLEEARLAGARAVVAMRPKAGWVLLAAVIPGAARCVPMADGMLKVPPRKDPRGAGPRRPVVFEDGPTVDALTPAGVQLTLPTD
jgi:hypothetical protein